MVGTIHIELSVRLSMCYLTSNSWARFDRFLRPAIAVSINEIRCACVSDLLNLKVTT